MSASHKSAITITYQKPFIDWNNKLFPDLPMEEDVLGEASTYLIKTEFDDPDKLLSKYFKQIFSHELTTITDDEKKWPSPLTPELFDRWFYYEISDSVHALES
jgi:hypothetical protein